MKYLRSTTLESKDIGFRKAEFKAKTQFLCLKLTENEKSILCILMLFIVF